jgi:hypothetical protein
LLVESGSERRFLCVGFLNALVYLSVCIFYLGGPESHGRVSRELIAWLCVLALLPLFYAGYRLISAHPTTPAIRLIIFFSAAFLIITFFTVPFHSTDVFGYINRGWQQAHYGENPYVFRLADTPGWQNDPMLREHWLYNPNPYGPLFSLLAWFLCVLGGGNWWLTLGLFKLINVLAFAATCWLVYDGSRRLGYRPAVALYLFAWNPLILIHHIANGHNDVLLGLCVVLAIYFLVREAYTWVLPALAVGILIKILPVLLVPLAVVYLYRRAGAKPILVGGLISAFIAILVVSPYLKDWQQLKLEEILDNAQLLDNSLHSFLIHIYEAFSRLLPWLGQFHDAVTTGIGIVLKAAFAALFLVLMYQVYRKPILENVIEKLVLALFIFICVISAKFNGWYMGMLLPGSLLLAERNWLRRVVVLVTAAQLGSITFLKQAYIVNYLLMHLAPLSAVYYQVRRHASITLPKPNYEHWQHPAELDDPRTP